MKSRVLVASVMLIAFVLAMESVTLTAETTRAELYLMAFAIGGLIFFSIVSLAVAGCEWRRQYVGGRVMNPKRKGG